MALDTNILCGAESELLASSIIIIRESLFVEVTELFSSLEVSWNFSVLWRKCMVFINLFLSIQQPCLGFFSRLHGKLQRYIYLPKHKYLFMHLTSQFLYNMHIIELTPQLKSEAFYSGELEDELRLLTADGNMKLEESILHHDADCDELMERIEHVRLHPIYPHHLCTQQCKERGY